jgi:hypothetical protein
LRLVQLQPCAGFDTAAPLTADLCKRFLDSGYKFVIRTTPWWTGCVHDHPEPDFQGWYYGLSRSERDVILDSGLKLGLYQMMHKSVRLDAATGEQRAANLAANARALSLPEGLTLWCDGEFQPAPSFAVMAFLRAFGRRLARDDHAGLYWGYEGLGGKQLYSLPGFTAYWRSAMKYLGDPFPRSFCMDQALESTVHGIDVDLDFMTYDSSVGHDRPWFVSA